MAGAMHYVMKKNYGENALVCLLLARALGPRVQMCVREVLDKTESESTKTFVYCDFGTADGRSSSLLFSAVASEVKRAGGPKEISLVLEDQEANDFRPAYGYVRQALDDGVAGRANVFVSTVGRSFHKQCVQSDCVHFATSVAAAHYLDTSRSLEGYQTGYSLPLLRRLRQVGRNLSALTGAERAQLNALSEKGAADWENFLLCRAKELRVGGQMMIVALSNVPDDVKDFPRFSDGVATTMDDHYILTADAVHELVEEGEIGEGEEQHFIVPSCYRTAGEAKAPFLKDDSPVRRAGLRVHHTEYIVGEHPRASERDNMAERTKAELQSMAAVFGAEVQAYTFPMVRKVLAECPSRSPEDVDRLSQEVFRRVEKAMISSRTIFMGAAYLLVVMEKISQ